MIQEPEPGRHHPDDPPWSRVHRHATTDNPAIAAAPPLPVTEGEHDRVAWPGPDLVAHLVLREPPAKHRLYAERLKRAIAHPQGPDFLRVAGARDAGGTGGPQAQRLKRPVPVQVHEVDRCRQFLDMTARHVAAHPRVLEAHELVSARIGERLDQHRIDDAEDRRRRTNPQREGDESRRGEGWRPPQRADDVPQVAKKVVEGNRTELIARTLSSDRWRRT